MLAQGEQAEGREPWVCDGVKTESPVAGRHTRVGIARRRRAAPLRGLIVSSICTPRAWGRNGPRTLG